jgi:C4-dicarboxylate-binding protein DctP
MICRNKIVVALLLVLVSASLVFANGTSEKSGESKTYVLKLGHDQMENTPHHLAAVKFKELVEERTGGNVKVEIYPAQQLGTSREMIEGMQIGTVEAACLPSAAYSGFDLATGLTDLPFLFPNPETAYKVLDGEMGDKIFARLEKIGLKGASYWTSGFKQFTANFPIDDPDDYKGKKIRVMSNPVLIAQYESMGASAVPIDFQELYNALQQKAVDGEENPLSTIVNMRFYEVQDYLTISNHGMLGYIFCFNDTWLKTLPSEYRDILVSAAKEVAPFERSEIQRLEKETYLPTIEAAGVEISTLTDAQRKQFEDITRPTYEIYASQLDSEGQELLAELQEAVESCK